MALDINGQIRISALIETIKKRGVSFKNEETLISYFSSEHDSFVFLGPDPLPSNATIPFIPTENEI